MTSSYHIGFANAQIFPWIVGKYGLSSLDLRSRVFWGGFGIEIVLTCYYREQEIVYIQDNFHHPPAYAEEASRRQVRSKKTGAHSRHGAH